MANQKLTPRQKMINMMYLVLIAMLALNVSREILKSFYLFELSFIQANEQISSRNSETMERFRTSMKNEKSKERTEQWFILAEKARNISDEFNAFVETMKKEVVLRGGGREVAEKGSNQLTELNKPDDMEEHAYFFMDEGLGNGRKLQKKINETREQLANLVLPARKGDIIRLSLIKTSQLKADDPITNGTTKGSWVNTYFESAPLAGVVTFLTKTQNDCKILEAEVLNVLSENISIESFVHDGQMALIIPENQTVMSGDMFRARIALATYDTKSESKMFVNGQEIKVSNGFGEISIPAIGTGSHSLAASIESIDPKTGEPAIIHSVPVQWSSFQASATISADNMNVLFIGLDNPMSISVPGITPANTVVSSDNGIIMMNLGNGKFTAKATGIANVGNIRVSAKMPDGSLKKMGEMSYRIRKVPEPKLKYGSLSSGNYDRSILKVQQFLYATLEDFYFKNVSFKVIKYRANILSKTRYSPPEIRENSNSLSKLQSIVASAGSGDILYIDEILVKGPSGEIRPEPIIIKIK